MRYLLVVTLSALIFTLPVPGGFCFGTGSAVTDPLTPLSPESGEQTTTHSNTDLDPHVTSTSNQFAGKQSPSQNQLIDQAVSSAVDSFLKNRLSPRARAESGEKIRKRLKQHPEEFVKNITFPSKRSLLSNDRLQVEAAISHAAIRGLLFEMVTPRTLCFALTGTKGGKKLSPGSISARLAAALDTRKHSFQLIAPEELESLFTQRPELRRTLGGSRTAEELGLGVLAELVCVGEVEIGAAPSHINGVYTGVAEAGLRVINCKTGEVAAAVVVDFRDKIPAMLHEAQKRAEKALYNKIAEKLIEKVAARKRKKVRLACSLGPLYPAFLRSYRITPFGEIRLRNLGDAAAGPFQVRLMFDKEVLLEPVTVDVAPLAPGAEKSISVSGILGASVLSLADSEIGAEVSVRGVDGGEVDRIKRAVLVHKLNAFSWSRPAAIAAYIDPDDPALQRFQTALRRSLPPDAAYGVNLMRAAALFEALAALRLRYQADPVSTFIDRRQAVVHDRVHFPSQTLREGIGDCDDFSVLYAAALESAGIRSALIVSGDHILAAFDTGITPPDAAEAVFGADGVVVRNGIAYLPVETTAFARGEPFLSAWRSAAQTAALLSSGEADWIEVRDAWRTWPPAFRSGTDEKVRLPGTVNADRLAASLKAVKKLITDRIASRAEAENRKGGEVRTAQLYAACGMPEKAVALLERIQKESGGYEASYNLGQALLLLPRDTGTLERAAGEFRRALEQMPEGDLFLRQRADALLRLALAYRLSGAIALEKKVLKQATSIMPAAGKTYTTLFSTATKAAGGRRPLIENFLLRGFLY